MYLGELGPCTLRVPQFARFVGARVRGICTFGRAFVPIASSSCAVCERVGVSRVHREDVKFVAVMRAKGRPNYCDHDEYL